jgi:ceramide glucosyltransferase
MYSILRIIQIVAVFGAISSSIYYVVCLWSAGAFLRKKRSTREGVLPTQWFPAVSILKPLKGTDPEMYESLRSHCLQDYPEYEIIFGVHDPKDPVVGSVRRLQSEFPDRAIQLVVCEKIPGANVKVSNLVAMVGAARYDHFVVNDSDIRVEPEYISRIVTPLADPETGMVTCLYRGHPAPTLGSRLESLGISTDFCAGVLAARQLEGAIRFGLGSTLAFRRRDLERIGGFEAIVDYLADDYELGKRIANLGLKVKLSETVVETHLPAYTMREFWDHQLRWARGIRDSRPGGYFGLLFTFGLVWSLAPLLAAHGARWAWMLAGFTLLLRFAVAVVVGTRVLADGGLTRRLWLLPIRDIVAVLIWMGSFLGHTVTWRGDRFELRDGKLVPTDR